MVFIGLLCLITPCICCVAYEEDPVDSTSIATSQQDEPYSPEGTSTKSVDELLQVLKLNIRSALRIPCKLLYI